MAWAPKGWSNTTTISICFLFGWGGREEIVCKESWLFAIVFLVVRASQFSRWRMEIQFPMQVLTDLFDRCHTIPFHGPVAACSVQIEKTHGKIAFCWYLGSPPYYYYSFSCKSPIGMFSSVSHYNYFYFIFPKRRTVLSPVATTTYYFYLCSGNSEIHVILFGR